LLDGALVHGDCGKLSLNHVWPVSFDEMECVEEPFLRALASLLLSLFEDNIWEKDKAIFLFEMLVKKLFIGEAVNLNCLKVLPLIMSVLIRPLSFRSDESTQVVQHDSFNASQMQDSIKDWLQRAILFSPSNAWQMEEGNFGCLSFYFSFYCFSP